MKYPGFIGPAYTLNSVNFDCQTCVNMFLEADEAGTGKNGETACLLGRPGLRTVLTVPDSPWRGLYRASNGKLYGVVGNKIVVVNDDSSYSYLRDSLGSVYEINTGGVNTRCCFADNGEYILLTAGSPDALINVAPVNIKMSSGVCTANTSAASASIYGAYWCEYKTGRFILIGFSNLSANRGKGIFWFSSLDSAGVAPTFSALDYLQAESAPDKLNQCLSSNDYLWMPGDNTVEIWQTTGEPSAPYQRVSGAIIEYGSVGVTACRVNNTVAWCGSQNGTLQVFAANGLQATRISTHGVEQGLAEVDPTGAYAWGYVSRGHSFYLLTFPASLKTWCYDFSTGGWSEWASFDFPLADGGKLAHYRGACHAFAYLQDYVGDNANGNLYVMDLSTGSDGDMPIYRERTAPHIASSLKRISYSKFQLDCEVGAASVDPGAEQVGLSWSDDGGRSFTSTSTRDLGGAGEYRHRLIWRRLGASRDRVFRVRYSGTERFVILGADIDVVQASS